MPKKKTETFAEEESIMSNTPDEIINEDTAEEPVIEKPKKPRKKASQILLEETLAEEAQETGIERKLSDNFMNEPVAEEVSTVTEPKDIKKPIMVIDDIIEYKANNSEEFSEEFNPEKEVVKEEILNNVASTITDIDYDNIIQESLAETLAELKPEKKVVKKEIPVKKKSRREELDDLYSELLYTGSPTGKFNIN